MSTGSSSQSTASGALAAAARGDHGRSHAAGKVVAGMRSDMTRPRTSSIGTGSTGSLGRQLSSGAGVAGTRTGRTSLATATTSGRTSAPAAAAATRSAAPPAPAATTTTSAASSSVAPNAAAAAAMPPQEEQQQQHTPNLRFRSNELFGEASSMTPSVRTAAYTPSLSPELQALEQQQQQHGLAAPVRQPAAAAAAAPAGGVVQGWTSAGGRSMSGSTGTVPGGSGAHAPAPTPLHFLPHTGDLFSPPDLKGDLVLNVGGTELKIPAWNHTRPWLTGSWLIEPPQEFLEEIGASTASTASGSSSSSSAGGVRFPPAIDLATVESTLQAELVVMDDIFNCMAGQMGDYIRAVVVKPEGSLWQRLGFFVYGVDDPGTREQLERLLPLYEAVLVVKRFQETRSYRDNTLVTQALAAAMRDEQAAWRLLMVQHENQMVMNKLTTVAELVNHCQKAAAPIILMARIACEAAASATFTSAQLLNLLVKWQAELVGDRVCHDLVGRLLATAAEPYFGILRTWVSEGVLEDFYAEFMVKEDSSIGADSMDSSGVSAFWSQRYKLRGGLEEGEAHDVPLFLAGSAHTILVTGKYLNAIRKCRQPVPDCPESTLKQLHYAPPGGAASAPAHEGIGGRIGGIGGLSNSCSGGPPSYLSGIQEAHSAAAEALLAHMMGPQGRLLSWLHCLKHVFLLDQGDLLVHLLQELEAEERRQRGRPLDSHRLQTLLDAALRSSSVAASPHMQVLKEGALRLVRDPRSLMQLVLDTDTLGGGTLKVEQQQPALLNISALAGGAGSWRDLLLVLRPAWPLNLVVGQRQLLQYQVVFRHLLTLKLAERQLGRVWQGLRVTRRLKSHQERCRPWHLLVAVLQAVVGEVLRFTCTDVLEPLWADMHDRLLSATNLDQVIACHDAFLAAVLERSLVRQPRVMEHMSALLSIAADLAGTLGPLTDMDASPEGGASSGSANVQEQLAVLSSFMQDKDSRGLLTGFAGRINAQLGGLLCKLEAHHQKLGCGGVGHEAPGGGTAAAAAAGDSSRELASLLNLVERLEATQGKLPLAVPGGPQ